jgi:hypothetical protein
MVWLAKGVVINGPLWLFCVFFYKQKVLERTQATSILRCVVIASEGFSKFLIFLGFSYSFWYASYNWWGIWNMICPLPLYGPLWDAFGSNLDSLSLSFVFPFLWVLCFIEFAKVSSIRKVRIFWKVARYVIQLKTSCLMVCCHVSKTLLTISYKIVLQLGCIQVQASVN